MTPFTRKRSFLTGMAFALAILLLDQASKAWILSFMDPQSPIAVTPFFNLALVWNYGISFGLFPARSQLVLILLSAVITAILLIWLAKNTCRLTAIALGLVIGGAAGNVIDRLLYGAVTDFLDFHIAGIHWPAFNIADSCIFIGVVLLCVSSMFMDEKNHQAKGSTP